MKRLLITAAALSLAAGNLAWAQEHKDEHKASGGGHPAGAPAGHPAGATGGHPGAPGGGRPMGNALVRPVQGAPGGRGDVQGGGFHGGVPGGAAGARGDFHNGAPGGGRSDFRGGDQGRPGAYNGGRPGGGRSEFQARPGGGYAFTGSRGYGAGFHSAGRFSYGGRSFNRYRVSPFAYPGGWGYRRWEVGAYLPGVFLSPAYFIDDFDGYNLGPPPPGCRWVRYGPDALAVNGYTGEVVDVAYGVFWW